MIKQDLIDIVTKQVTRFEVIDHTKKKGGRTVDNCVPIGEHWEQHIAKAIKLLESK